MNTGQTLLVTVGLLLFTIFVLTVYRTTTSRFAIAIANESILTGTAIAQSMIDEIVQKSFDEKVLGSNFSTPDSLTPLNLLGPDIGENDITTFDDIDDFNGYKRVDSLQRLGNFKVQVQVYYVNPNSPDQKSLTKTFAKKIEVYIINNFLTDTIKMYRVVTF